MFLATGHARHLYKQSLNDKYEAGNDLRWLTVVSEKRPSGCGTGREKVERVKSDFLLS